MNSLHSWLRARGRVAFALLAFAAVGVGCGSDSPPTLTDAAVDGVPADAFVPGSNLPTTTVAPGREHTCVLREAADHLSTEVVCWGSNSDGQLGVASGDNQCSPIPGLTDAVEIDSGWYSTCARLRGGGVRCWGSGMLGDGVVTTRSPTPVTVSGLTDATQVGVGREHSCALRSGGAVVCWGNGRLNQLGGGMSRNSLTPTAVVGITDAVEISVGELHACARLSSGTVRCWGFHSACRLGDGTCRSSTTPVMVVGVSDAVEIAAGGDHSCVRLRSGAVQCWGANTFGQLGMPPSSSSATPITVAGISDAAEITAGSDHTCARQSTGAVRCWGNNGVGQLGNGSNLHSGTPVTVSGLTDAVEVVAGDDHTCARLRSGEVRCWGENSDRQLGDGTAEDRSTPVSPTCNAGCTTGRTVCDLACVDVQTDATHCGSCDRECAAGQTCAGGVCRDATTCDDGRTLCAGVCVDTQTHEAHCGMCGRACAAGETCTAGACGRVGASILATGGFHTCAIVGDGVRCWGNNVSGQLGNGVTRNSSTCVAVAGLRDVVEVVGGARFSCARLRSGEVRCWGDNYSGQLGTGMTSPRSLAPVAVAGITDAVQVAAGDDFACARQTSGGVWCWGSNDFGELGRGMSVVPAPAAVTGITDAVEIAAGAFHACARLRSGEIRCWGYSASGQLGPAMVRSYSSFTPVAVTGITDAVEITAGDAHTCARRSSGEVLCWGQGLRGQLGNDMLTNSPTPVAVAGLTDAVEVSAGGEQTCARRRAGEVRCWGNNRYGQLGNGTTDGAVATPVAVSGLTDAVELDLGDFHACARRSTGAVLCWGRNTYGQLGDGTTTDRTSPVPVTCFAGCMTGQTTCAEMCVDTQTSTSHCGGCDQACPRGQTCAGGMCRAAVTCAAGQTVCAGVCVDPQTDASHCGMCGRACATGETCTAGVCGRAGANIVTAGGFHTCAIVGDGVRCWGSNGSGQLGDGTTRAGTTCVSVTDLRDVVEVSGGFFHTCARLRSGAVRCWGYNRDGQLGTGTAGAPRLTPAAVVGITDAVEIAAGGFHSCARLRSGEVRCWGDNSSGQLGTGTVSARSPTPVAVVGITDAVEIAVGLSHSCARRSTGEVRCWGSNSDGQLGVRVATSLGSATPLVIAGLTDAVEIAAGVAHNCARLRSGEVRCWGNNFSQQLGNGMDVNSATPVMVLGVTDAVEVGAGRYFTCARRSSGQVFCWGRNTDGQLGSVTPDIFSPMPVAVSGLTDAVELDVGEGHACARRSTGAVLCWGRNAYGEVGDGTTTTRTTPVLVTCFSGCAAGQSACAAGCVDLQTDAANCGTCGNACGTGGTCRAGACMSARPTCTTGQTDCTPAAPAPTCVDTTSDARNCGGCGVVCPAGQSCSASMCRAPRAMCTTGQTDCTPTAPAPTCIDTTSDARNCGACGTVCTSGQRCVAGTCRITCDAPRVICGTGSAQSCVDLTNDNASCGMCGNACTPGRVCAASTCTTACDAPRTVCASACVDTSTDRANCGACGMACPTGQSCAAGACVGDGALRITLTWDRDGDMDLHVLPPCATEIFYSNRMACGGTLDVDNTTTRGPENVFWDTTPPTGRYLICPESYGEATVGATWTLTVVRGSTTILTRTGVRDRADSNTPCTAAFPGVVTLDL